MGNDFSNEQDNDRFYNGIIVNKNKNSVFFKRNNIKIYNC